MKEQVPLQGQSPEAIAPTPKDIDFATERRDMVGAADAYIAHNTNPDGTIGKLTDLQSKTLLKVRDFAAGEGTHGMLNLPCGFGKSALATTVVDALGIGLTRRDGSRRQALLNTSRNSIVGQLVNRNVQYGSNDDDGELMSDFAFFAPRIRPTTYNRYGKDATGDVVVMPYQSLGSVIKSGALQPEQFSLYLLDESHNMGEGRHKIYKKFAKDALFIGLSATPERSREFLPETIERITLTEGIVKHKILSDVKLFGLSTGHNFYPTTYVAGEYSPEDTEHLARSVSRNQMIIDEIYTNVTLLGSGLVKCHRKLPNGFEHLKELTQMANYMAPLITRNGKTRKLRVEAVSSSIKGSQAVIDEFMYGDSIDALAFVDLIGEGFNMPHANWGIWVPPTRSYRALEQFIGRGVRLDPGNPAKTFHFTQLQDADTRNDKNAFGWELFDAPRDSKETHVTKDDGVIYRTNKATPSSGKSDEQPKPQFTVQSAENRLLTLSLDSSMRENYPATEMVALDEVQQTIGVDRAWLKRILYDGGFTAFVRLINDEPVLAYEKGALEFIKKEMAAPEDKSILDVAKKIEMSEGTTRRWIDLLEVPVKQAFSRVWVAARKQGYLTPEAFAEFVEKLENAAMPLQPHEIKLNDVVKTLSLSRHQANYKKFQERGFTITNRKTLVGQKAQFIALKGEMLPWMEAYKNADTPPEGYVWLAGLLRCKALNDATYSDVLIALYNLGIKPQLCMRGSRDRADFIPASSEAAVVAEAVKISRQRIAAESDHSVVAPKISGCVYGSDPKFSVIEDAAEEATKNIEPADEGVSQASHPAKDVANEVALEAPAAAAGIDRGGVVDFPQNVKAAVISRHVAFRDIDLHDKKNQGYINETLRNILGRVATPLPEVPRYWVYSGNLARELNIPEQKLIRLLVEKRVSSEHARYIDLNGVKGLMAFYSPQLADRLRSRRKR